MKHIFTISCLLIILSFDGFSQINPLMYKWQGTTSSSWSNSTNWQVWDQGTSSWVTNSLGTFPNASTHTVTIDFTSVTTKTVVLDVATNNADVSEMYIINNSAGAGYFNLSTGKQLSVYNTFSVSGTNTNSISIYSTGDYSGYSDAFGQVAGGSRILFVPVSGNTVSPIFSNAKYESINITIAGTGTTNFTENNLSFQSLFHNSGNFNLLNKTINLKTSYQLFSPVPGVNGFSNLTGSIINTQCLLFATNANLNFSALTSTINLIATTLDYMIIYMTGNNAATSTATISNLTINGSNKPSGFYVDGRYLTGISCATKIFIENFTANCSELQFNPYATGQGADFRIKHWNLQKPLNIIAHNHASKVRLNDISSITTATSVCNTTYHFIGVANQVDIATVSSFTVKNMSFFNAKVNVGSITSDGGVNIGYTNGINFINSPTTFGVNTYTWNGSVNTNWANSSNWTPNCIPSILDNVLVPSGTSNSLYLKNSSGICYNFNTIGAPTITIENSGVPLFVGGNFIRSANTVITPPSLGAHQSTGIYLMGILPNTTYSITSNNTLLSHAVVTINANHNGSGYELTDAFSANYPAMNHSAFGLLSGKFKTNGYAFETQSLTLARNNVATATRSLNIANSTVKLHYTSYPGHLSVDCFNVNEFNTTNSTIYLNMDNFQPMSTNRIEFVNVPTNNHLATPSFSLDRVIIGKSNTIPGVIDIINVFSNTTIGSGIKIKSLKALGSLNLTTNNVGTNFLTMDSLYVTAGYYLNGTSNSSITINNYISSTSGCASGRFSATSTSPGSAANNQFIINTGPTVTYTLSHWDINSVKVNPSTAGVPAITVNEAYINPNSGTSPSNGWNPTTISSKTFYWVGEGTTTNWSDLDNWSFSVPTNGDDATAGCLPSIYDDVIFTNMSFYGNSLGTVNTTSIVMVDDNIGFRDMRWMGPFTTSTTNTIALMPKITNTISDVVMNCYGSIRMHKTMNWNFGKIWINNNHVRFYSTTQDTIEIQNNSFWGHIYFYGSGKYIVKDSLMLDNHLGLSLATLRGFIIQTNGELDLQGNKVYGHGIYSGGYLRTGPIKLNINNSKLVFDAYSGWGLNLPIMFGSQTPNTYTLEATNSIIKIYSAHDNGGHSTCEFYTSSPPLKFNVIQAIPPNQAVTYYNIAKYGTGYVTIDSLLFDYARSYMINATTQPDSINYLKYRVGSTNEITSNRTLYVNELDAKSACDPITIKSSVIGSYANLCPSSNTSLKASQATLNYINSACGSYTATNYSELKGNLSAFIPAGSENASGWNLNTAASPLGFVSNKSAIVNCSQLPLSINASEFNASPTTHTLTWQSANGTFVGTPSNGLNYTTFTTTATGVHTLTVLYRVGCSVTDTYTVSTINDVSSTYTMSNVSCNGLSNGSFSVTASTGSLSSTYNYFISPGNYTTNVISNLSPNAYTYSINNTINPGSCNTVGTFTITEPSVLTTSAIVTSSVACKGASTASLTCSTSGGNSSYSYNWTDGTTTYTAQNLNNVAIGVYSLSVTDNLNCSATSTALVSEPSNSVSITSITSTSVLCFGGTATATVNAVGGTGTLSYNFGTGAITSNTTLLVANNYMVTVADANNCVASGSLQINEPTQALILPTVTNNTIACNGGTTNVLANASGGTAPYVYTWATNTSTINTAVYQAGTYTVNVTDANNCSSSLQTFNVTEPQVLNIQVTTINNITCTNPVSSVTYSATGGTSSYAYLFTPQTTSIQSFTTLASSTSSLAQGTYSLIVTDNNGCNTYTVFSISIFSVVPIVSTSIQSITCNGNATGAITASVSSISPFTYLWSNNGETTGAISDLYAGVYTLVVTDANSCQSTHTAVVNEPTMITVNEKSNVVSCDNEPTGSLIIEVTGGVPTYSVVWDNGNTGLQIQNSPKAALTVTVTDANSCVLIYQTTIEEKRCLETFIPQVISPDGNGKNDILFINTAGYYPNNKIEIFNRWGSLVYTKKNYDNIFEGKANVGDAAGTGLLPAGTYYVVFDFGDMETKPYHGFFELRY